MTEVECPHCEKKHDVNIHAVIPDTQEMSVTIKSESDMIAADAFGLLMVNTTQALQAVAKNIGGKVAVFILSCTVTPNEIKTDFLVTSVKTKRKKTT